MPKFKVKIIEIVTSVYEDVIEADTSDQAKLQLEDWIVNHPDDVEPISETQDAIVYHTTKLGEGA